MDNAEAAPLDWAAIRTDYDDRANTLGAICEKYGISRGILQRRVKRDLWTPRLATTVPDRKAIIRRLFHLLEKQIVHLEENMTQTGEKEVAVLGKLVSTLEKLIEIDGAATPPKPAARQKDMQDIRNKLAERIAQLKRV